MNSRPLARAALLGRALVRFFKVMTRKPSAERRAILLALASVLVIAVQAGPLSAQQCYWDGKAPFCGGSCRSGYIVTKREACVTGHKVLCCEQTGSVTSDGAGQPYVPAQTAPAEATPCPSGLVWRERFDGDTVCVTPIETVGPLATASPSRSAIIASPRRSSRSPGAKRPTPSSGPSRTKPTGTSLPSCGGFCWPSSSPST